MKRKQPDTARPTGFRRVIYIYGLPLYLAALAIAALAFALTADPVTPAQLIEVQGTLKSYNYRGDRSMFLSINGRPERFWTYAVGSENGTAGLTNGSHLRFYAVRQPQDDSVRSYGLWIDGREVESLERALRSETGAQQSLVPLAFVCLGLAMYIYRRRAFTPALPAVTSNS